MDDLVEKYRTGDVNLRAIVDAIDKMPDKEGLRILSEVKKIEVERHGISRFYNRLAKVTDIRKFAERYGKYLED